MKIAKHAGINGILLEWEDTFPWKGSLANITLIKGGYSLEEVHEIVDFAEKSMGFEVIPLIQT
jgi:hexosaminidase